MAGRIGGFVRGSFLAGAGAAYFNFRLIERVVNRLGRLAARSPAKPPKASASGCLSSSLCSFWGPLLYFDLSGFNVVAALCGFLVCPAAVMFEILYELITYGHS